MKTWVLWSERLLDTEKMDEVRCLLFLFPLLNSTFFLNEVSEMNI